MRKNVLFVAPLLVIIFIVGCKKTEIKSQWPTQEIKIDGDHSDWQNIPAEYFKNPNASISIANDEQNLYMLLRFSDEILARKILRRGVTIYFDKDKQSGIRYRGNFALAESLRSSRTGQSSNPQMDQRQFPGIGNLGMIAIFNQKDRELLRENNNSGLNASAEFRDGVFTYEFSIPRKQPKEIPVKLATDSGDKLKLGFEIGGVDREKLKKLQQQRQSTSRGMGGRDERMGGRSMGGRPGGMGGRGGSRGGRMGGNYSERPSMAPQEVWIDVQLATEK